MSPGAAVLLEFIVMLWKALDVSCASSLKGISCTFDTDLCGWRQSLSDDFDWTLEAGPAPSNDTGPSRDHTTGSGKYLYIKTDYPRKQNDRAKLVYGPFSGFFCLSFYYHMHGPAIGALRLFVDGYNVFAVTEEQGSYWMQAQVMLNGSDSELTFEGVVGAGPQGDLALDDILVSDHCNVSSCAVIMALVHGNITCSANNSIGSQCNITCSPGYSLIGSSTRTCLVSGVWSGRLTYCIKEIDDVSKKTYAWKTKDDLFTVVEVRLAGGNSPMQGRVEIAVNGVWGTICDDNWTLKSATVICRMLGHPPASAAPGDSGFGEGTGKIWLDKVRCSGSESSVIDCPHLGFGAWRQCTHEEDAGVICGNITSFEVRLVSLSASNEGRVEVSVNGVWGTVCDDSWSIEDADVVCRMLRLPQATAATLGSSFGRGTGPILMDNVKCVGNESSLLFCPRAELGEKDCAHLEDSGVICGPPTVQARNVALGKPVTQSHSSQHGHGSLAVDELFNTCTTLQTVTNPWLQVDLINNYNVHTVHVLLGVDCCPDIDLEVSISGVINQPDKQRYIQPSPLVKRNFHVFHCTPPVRGRFVTVHVTGQSVPLVLCGLAVYGFKSLKESSGVLREAWFNAIPTQDDPIMKYNPAFERAADTLSLLELFHIAPTFATPYGQRLSAYIQPPTGGSYTFYITCEDECELWIDKTKETGLSDDNENDGRLILKLPTKTSKHAWDEKSEMQKSKRMYLSSCMFYVLEGFSREAYRYGHVSVGWRLPGNDVERPIIGNHSHWVLPGERVLTFDLQEEVKDLSITFGSPVFITASYKLCCHGMYCPDCPLKIELFVLGQNHTIESSLEMTCREKQYNMTLSAAVQPGRYITEVRYSFVNDSEVGERRRRLGQITVYVSVVQECNFDSSEGLCTGWKTGKQEAENEANWNFSVQNEAVGRQGPDHFAYIGGARTATLETPEISWQSLAESIRLCLTFLYSMRSQSEANLKVRLKSMYLGNETLLYHLIGFHGDEWLEGHVSWNSIKDSKIIFEGSSNTNETFAIGINNVSVTTEGCEMNPLYSTPGHTCSSDEFQCDNGACVTATMRCDGDVACLDQSDERDCTCLSDQFKCVSGGCIAVTALCDGQNDCQDDSDELNCGKLCTQFQCADGSCIPWSNTCSVTEQFCADNTHSPVVCSYGKCPLNNLDCARKRKTEPHCKSFRGYCGFENGLCGLTSDNSIEEFQWTPGSGETPSENTGPSYDHSTFTEQGIYMFIEASQRAFGDRARLISDWLAPSESVCLQFWYHMYGRHIGAFNVYLKSNNSERLVWHQEGDQGDQWIFAQTFIREPGAYKFVLEGVAGYGLEGDIALDDISVLDGTCAPITRQVTLDCDFSEDKCAWSGHPDWKVDPGGFLYLRGGSKINRVLTSPLISNSSAQCIRFWFNSEGKYFKRSLQLFINSSDSSTSSLIWSVSEETPDWTFIQLPLQSTSKTFKVVFMGLKEQSQPSINVKSISFSKEDCGKIAPSIECFDYLTLNTADRLVNYSERADMCDDTLDINRWYRIAGAAGTQIPEWSVPSRHCGARYPGWMEGEHPLVDDGVVTRGVCFVFGYRSCRWKVTIKVRNCGEFYVYKLTAPSYCTQRYCGYNGKGEKILHSVDEWWGWRNDDPSTLWKMKNASDTRKLNEVIGSLNVNNDIPGNSRGFELHFRDQDIVYTEVRHLASLTALTFCLWVATKSSGLTVDYNVTTEERRYRGFGLMSNRRGLELIFMENATRTSTISFNDGQWHHVCFTWKSVTGEWRTYKDGKSVGQTNQPFSIKSIPGSGNLSIIFSAESENPEFLGKISTLNLWDHFMDSREINHMSYGRGDHLGNVLSWAMIGRTLRGRFDRKNSSTSTEHQGPRLVAESSSTADINIAVYMSPLFNWSANSYGKCLKFHYKLYGPGANSLKIFQVMDYEFGKQPIWVDHASKPDNWWHYGQISISTVSSFRVIIEGQLDKRPGYIAIGGVYMARGYCQPQPLTSNRACNQNLTSSSGYIISPYYPGYYSNNVTCTWVVTAPEDHVIRLEFQSFAVELHPKCDNDYVTVREDDRHASRIIGKYCGHTFPNVIESSSNTLTIIFSSNGVNSMTGFKAYYSTELGKRASCIQDCPRGCTCSRLPAYVGVQVKSDSLTSLPGYFPETTAVILFENNKISRVRNGDFTSLQQLSYLDLSNNVILELDGAVFRTLSSLTTLRLNGNFLERVASEDFQGLQHLRTLDLGANLLSELRSGTFKYVANLRVLSLRSNRIEKIQQDAFQGLENLTYLYLHDNNLTSIQRSSFKGLESLETLFLHGNPLSEADVAPDAFDELKNLKNLTLDKFILCCYAKKAIQFLNCQSPESAFSSCEDLMKSDGLRMCIWILGLLAFMGNLLVIIWRIRMREDNKVQSFMLINLACADFLMGVYLLIIAIKDLQWTGEYFKHDVEWRRGHLCQFAGALSVLSSEVSVFMLSVITADRLICVVFALKIRALSRKAARIICACVWLLGVIISFVPMLGISYFWDEKQQIGFFGKSAVCLPFQLTKDRSAGWEYSVTFFMALNGVAFLFILAAYVVMFWTALGIVRRSTKHMMKSESTRATRLFCIVLTDFFCWMPVIILGILSLTGDFHDPKQVASVWIAVFVLPVNSSINPILYTFSTLGVRRKIRAKFRVRFAARKDSDNAARSKDLGTRGSVLDTVQSESRQTGHYPPSPPRRKLQILGKADGFVQDSDGVFHLIAIEGSKREGSTLLLKCFQPSKQNVFSNELLVQEKLSLGAERTNIPSVRWHAKADSLEIFSARVDTPQLDENASVICYDYVSGIPLSSFLQKERSLISLGLVHYIAVDVIKALEYLHEHGVYHNDVAARNVLIIERPGIPPWKAMLINFDQASLETSHVTDVQNFGELLKEMLQCCSDVDQEIRVVVDACGSSSSKNSITTAEVRRQLEESWGSFFMETQL